jgi:molybdenum cofactor biosynthesis enzyme
MTMLLNKLNHRINFKNLSFRNFCVVLSHTGPNKMVNVGPKSESLRYAKASCLITMNNKEVNQIN